MFDNTNAGFSPPSWISLAVY